MNNINAINGNWKSFVQTIVNWVWNIYLSFYQGNEEFADKANEDVECTYANVEEILDEYGNSILRLGYSYLHNKADAEEVLQDTLIQYIQKKPEFHTKEYEKKWLLTVASNLSKNRIKYNLLRQSDELSEELVSENREDLSFVWDAVKKLPKKYRMVIHLFYDEGYQTSEIAEILNQKETTIRSHLARAREKLKVVLKEEYDFE